MHVLVGTPHKTLLVHEGSINKQTSIYNEQKRGHPQTMTRSKRSHQRTIRPVCDSVAHTTKLLVKHKNICAGRGEANFYQVDKRTIFLLLFLASVNKHKYIPQHTLALDQLSGITKECFAEKCGSPLLPHLGSLF